ncbi:MAG: nucleoside phosphorylase [Candidatus Thermoplasmatota archaeon]|nr:nucleoside phosphorylase [Candidatus Thermoplasmatota archaeon]
MSREFDHLGMDTWHACEKEVIRPEMLAKPLDIRTAIMSFTETLFETILNVLDMNDAPSAPTLDGAVDGRIRNGIIVYRSAIGAPTAGMLLEELIASGIRRIIMIGLAGSITPRCRIGDLVVPTWGIREEGTSYHYLPPGHPVKPSHETLAELKAALGDIAYSEGGIWSTDAPFRESITKVQDYQKAGAVAVDMECTALMAISTFRKVDFVSLIVISDEVFRDEWSEGFDTDHLKKSINSACQVLKGFLSDE